MGFVDSLTHTIVDYYVHALLHNSLTDSSFIIQELPAHKRQVNGVKFSCDAKRVVSCGSDFYMKVIDLQTGTILFSKGKIFFVICS